MMSTHAMQVMRPNKGGDYEIFVEDAATWSVLSSSASAALSITNGAFAWPELFPSAAAAASAESVNATDLPSLPVDN